MTHSYPQYALALVLGSAKLLGQGESSKPTVHWVSFPVSWQVDEGSVEHRKDEYVLLKRRYISVRKHIREKECTKIKPQEDNRE